MNNSLIEKRVNQTNDNMQRYTGKVPGNPTGLCFAYAVNVLCDNKFGFKEPGSPLGELVYLEEAQLVFYPTEFTGSVGAAMKCLLQQYEVEVDSVFITGTVNRALARHAAAVIPTDNRHFSIVDSLLSGGLKKVQGDEVTCYLEWQFRSPGLTFRVIPTKDEIARRSKDRDQRIQVGPQVAIFAPPLRR